MTESIGKALEGALVLVTGATGFTGSYLTKKLVAAGARVRAIARESSDISPFDGLAIDWYRGDVYDPWVVEEAAKDVEYIFHVAAAFREAGMDDDVYHAVHVSATQMLAEAARKNPHFKRFIHISTIGVHSHVDQPPADEEYKFQPDDIYQQTKAEGERWIRKFADEEKLPYVVIRPAAIYGPGDRRLLKFFKMAAKGRLLLLGPEGVNYHLIHVDDLTNVFMLAATHPDAEGEVFICGNEKCIPYDEMGRVIAKTYGKDLRVIRLPVGPFFAAAAVCEVLCKPFGIEPPLHRRRVAFFTKNREFDTSKLRTKLGYTPRSSEEGLVETAKSYVDAGWLKL